jgi:hypothetical protein
MPQSIHVKKICTTIICVLISNLIKRKDSKVIEPAFPAMHYDLADNEHGLTMRDYFAAKAMQGLLASDVNAPLDTFAKQAYIVADAMMEARNAAQ